MRSLVTLFIPDNRYESFMFRSGLALYAAVLLFGAVPGARAEVGEYASSLVLHFVTYGIITFLLATGLSGKASRRAAMAFGMVVLMGALDECIQTLVPWRNGATIDWLVDTGAALLVALSIRLAGARTSMAAPG